MKHVTRVVIAFCTGASYGHWLFGRLGVAVGFAFCALMGCAVLLNGWYAEWYAERHYRGDV